MTLGPKLERNRTARDAAKTALTSRIDQVRADLAERSIAGRIVDKVAATAAEVAAETVDVVRTNTPVIAGTLTILVAWVLRFRLAALIRGGDPEDYTDAFSANKEWNS